MKKAKELTRKEVNAILILIARDLKINIGYIAEAENIYKTGEIDTCLIGLFEKEADKAVELINKLELVPQATELINNYCIC